MSAPSVSQVAAVRRFNRFYAARARLLDEGHLGSPFSLAEVRLLYEIAHGDSPTASDLCRHLGLDAGYVSRVLRDIAKRGLVARSRSTEDRRQSHLSLTAKGRKAFAPLDKQAGERMQEMLGQLQPSNRDALVSAMETVQRAFRSAEPAAAPESRVRFRPPRPGDLGWVVQRHGDLYAREYGYDERFEALVATIVGEYVANHVRARERCWIAELNGERVGSVFLVQKSKTVAKLRLLLVEPTARGHGIGAKLVRLCTEFAREAGYKAITLYTQSELTSARKLYVAEGYELESSTRHRDFGKPCVAEIWTKQLRITGNR